MSKAPWTLTATFFCVMTHTLFCPRTPTVVRPGALTALNAYSVTTRRRGEAERSEREGEVSTRARRRDSTAAATAPRTDLVQTPLGREDRDVAVVAAVARAAAHCVGRVKVGCVDLHYTDRSSLMHYQSRLREPAAPPGFGPAP